MKKLMMIMGLCSIVLFGADMQVLGSGTKVLASSEKTDSLKIPKNSKQIKFNEEEPAQITLNVSVDVDPLEVSALTEESRARIKETVVQCYVYIGEKMYEGYMTELPLKSGQNNLKVKFNEIPQEEILYIDAYTCFLALKTDDGRLWNAEEALPAKYYSKLVWIQEGSID